MEVKGGTSHIRFDIKREQPDKFGFKGGGGGGEVWASSLHKTVST
jgi:hypothetical protein